LQDIELAMVSQQVRFGLLLLPRKRRKRGHAGIHRQCHDTLAAVSYRSKPRGYSITSSARRVDVST